MNSQVKCPKCSSSTITANKKGFSLKKAAAAAIMTGPIGLAAGAIGSSQIIITCLNCGNEFKPGNVKIIDENHSLKFESKSPPKIAKKIWDENTKSYIINPDYKERSTYPGVKILASILLILIILYILTRII